MFNEKLRNKKSYSKRKKERKKERKNGIKKETKEKRGKHIDQWLIALHRMNTLSFYL